MRDFCEITMGSKRTAIGFGLSAVVALALCGCSSQIVDFSPEELLGRSKEAAPAVPVNEVPQNRDDATITPEQRAKIEAELKAAREHQDALIRDADKATGQSSKR